MKFRSILATLAVAVTTLAAAGPAAAREHLPQPSGPTLDVTMSGPSGVVWTGQCQAFIYEDKMEQLPPNCRAHGSNWAQSASEGLGEPETFVSHSTIRRDWTLTRASLCWRSLPCA